MIRRRKMKKKSLILLGVFAFAVIIIISIIASSANDSYEPSQPVNESENTNVEIEELLHKTEVPDGYIGIYTVDDFDYVRNMENGSFILMNDIDMTGIEWVSDIELTGVFDGNNYSINNYSTPVSFFHRLTNGTIKNLKMNVSINGKLIDKQFNENGTPNQDAFIFGALVAVVEKYLDGSCEISNIDISGDISITKAYSVGGIIGYIMQTDRVSNQTNFVGDIKVSDCIFRATLTSDTPKYIGGIIGGTANATTLIINSCVNTGKIVFNSSECVGGIVSKASWAIGNCGNYGDIIGSAENVGGICGSSEGRDDSKGHEVNSLGISSCYNDGKINSAGAASGGIIGNARKVYEVNNCLNMGNVVGEKAGGIAGKDFSVGHLRNSCNLGIINGKDMSGALIGEYSSGNIIPENCYYLDNNIEPVGIKCSFPFVHKITQEQWNSGEKIKLPESDWINSSEGGVTLLAHKLNKENFEF